MTKLKAVFQGRPILREDVAELAKALRGLYDCQQGPPLLRAKEKDTWEKAMAEAKRLLQEWEE